MNENSYIYYCTRNCPIKKHCFIIKLEEEPKNPLPVLLKCKAEKKDIKITIGAERPP